MSDPMNDAMPEPFTWRGIDFRWHQHRQAMAGNFLIGQRRHWVFVKEHARFQAWIEWEGGYTRPCTMQERTDALEGARLELLDCVREYHEALLVRFG